MSSWEARVADGGPFVPSTPGIWSGDGKAGPRRPDDAGSPPPKLDPRRKEPDSPLLRALRFAADDDALSTSFCDFAAATAICIGVNEPFDEIDFRNDPSHDVRGPGCRHVWTGMHFPA